MSASSIEHAAPPPIPSSAFSRPVSRRRSSPSAEIWRQRRSTSDAHFKPASTDVISNLLASFGSISVPTEDVHVHPALRNSSSGLAGISSSRRPSSSAAPASQDLHAPYPQVKRRSESPANLWVVEDVAEPPIIRTSRSSMSHPRPDAPKLVSRPTSPQFPPSISRRAGGGATEDGDWAAELLQPDDQLSPLPHETSYPGQQSPPLGRLSLDSNGYDEGGWVPPSVLRASKGKEKLIDAPILRPPRINSYDSHRLGQVFSPPVPPSRLSSRRSSTTTATNDDPPVAGPSQANRRYSSQDPPTKDRTSKDRTNSVPRPGKAVPEFLESGIVVPVRGSSLKRVDSLTLLRRRGSVRSTGPVSKDVSTPTKTPDPETPKVPKLVDDEESDVLKRIKELKEAKEERRRSLAKEERRRSLTSQPSRPSSSHAIQSSQVPLVPPLPTTSPDTTVASEQIAEAMQMEEHRISTEAGVSEHSFAASSVFSSLTGGSGDIVPVEFVNFSRDKPTVIRGASSFKPRASVDSAQPQPNQPKSRSNSRFRRWSQPAPELRSAEGSFSKDLSRGGSPLSRPPLFGERRSSIDSMQESITTFLQSPRLSQKVQVPDEHRTITFSEVGDPRGHVIFCCVGMGMTRYVMAFYDELATSLKLRLITPDRPGVGDSEPYAGGSRGPITWPDDVQVICNHLQIAKFSLLAHSAGAIYALATALRMPFRIRGKVHLLAPWIPPSQMTAAYGSPSTPPSVGVLPRSQRFLRILPTPFLKLSTSSWVLNAGFTRNKSPPKSLKPKIRSSSNRVRDSIDTASPANSPRMSINQIRAAISPPMTRPSPRPSSDALASPTIDDVLNSVPNQPALPDVTHPSIEVAKERQRRYDAALTPAIWELATRNANPAIDLLVCLERNQPIGFRYADVDVGAQGVVIHHGSRDTRVPVENVKWLGRTMRGAEVRVVEGEGHGLMASAGVMGSVLTEMGREIEGWEGL